jgi:hypothetical protein
MLDIRREHPVNFPKTNKKMMACGWDEKGWGQAHLVDRVLREVGGPAVPRHIHRH